MSLSSITYQHKDTPTREEDTENQVTDSKLKDYVTFGIGKSCLHIAVPHKRFTFGNERYSLVFNGEIYNGAEVCNNVLKRADYDKSYLEHHIIASLFLTEGVESFSKLRGKFTIFIWDSVEEKMYGVRDHFGIKPLYYTESNNEVYFAIEKKEIKLPNDEDGINPTALQHYLTYQYVPEPLTLTTGIQKIKPGYYFIKELDKPMKFKRYFHATFQPVKLGEHELQERIRQSLFDSVQVHMQGDANIGSFLSGGIDSSILVAIAKEINPNLKTFSVGFEGKGYSEVDLAKRTADELNVENFSSIVTPDEYIAVLPEIIWHMEDPLADPSSVPLYFAAREARKHVDTVLSGEGADELFGGYNIYREPISLKLFQHLPNILNRALYCISTIFPEGMKGKSFLERGTTPLRDRYIGNAKIFEENSKQQLLKNYQEHTLYQTITAPLYDQVTDENAINQMQYIDIHTWLPGNILLKATKMAKANSLEVRVPFLDKKVFDVARTIPAEENVSKGTTKLSLRNAFKKSIPDHMLYRKKLGFPVPIKHWLKKELYLWAKQLIYESETDHILNKGAILELLKRHAQNKGDYSRKIWTILTFMLWHQIFVERIHSH